MKTGLLAGCWAVIFLFLQATAGASTVLVDQGKAKATIVIGKRAIDAANDAAAELQRYVKKMTGAELPIVDDENDVKGTKILVGESRHTRALGLKNDDFKDQEYLVKTAGDDLVLMGKDGSVAEVEKTAGKPGFMAKKYYQKIGSIYAVDTFLEKYCGVRWYLPDEIGEVVPEKKSISIGNIDIRRQPAVRLRLFSGWDTIPKTLWTWKDREYPGKLAPSKRLWWARRLKAGGEIFQCNHSFYGYYKRFGSTHPEWFADRKPEGNNQLCLSNPEVFKQVVQDARDFFDGKLDDPNAAAAGDVFSVMPMDSATWCQCDKCRPLYDQSEKKKVWWSGYASEYVWKFVSAAADEIARSHPGKYISCCAYWDYMKPPKNTKVPSNVKVMLCKEHWKQWDPHALKADRDLMAAWREKLGGGNNVYFWDYYAFPQYLKNYRTFPSIAPHLIASDIQAMKKEGTCGGQFSNTHGPTGMNLGPDHLRIYVTAKLLDDWNADVDQILNEYYRLFYGPAEKPMKEFFAKMEKVYGADNPRLKPVIESETEPQISITIDLGSVQSLRGVAFSTVADAGSGVFWPASIVILASADGKNFREIGDLVKLSAVKGAPPDPKAGHNKHRFQADNLNAEARYIRFKVQANGNYIFTDEIEIYREPASKNIALGKPCFMSRQPNYPLTADPGDATQLTDGVYTPGHFWTAKSTVGWQESGRLSNEFVWTVLCPPEELADYGRLLKEAKTAVSEDSVYAKRINFIEESVYQAMMVESSQKYNP